MYYVAKGLPSDLKQSLDHSLPLHQPLTVLGRTEDHYYMYNYTAQRNAGNFSGMLIDEHELIGLLCRHYTLTSCLTDWPLPAMAPTDSINA